MPPTRRRSAGLVALLAVLGLLGPSASAQASPVHSERLVLGRSVQGRPIVAWHRWHDGANRTLLVLGNVHGDEQAGLRVVRRLRRAPLPPAVDLWVIPSGNPDGTAADRRTNAHGVDLNRNFPRFWRRTGRGTTQWSGPVAASEPETRLLMRVVRRLRPRTTVVLHQPLSGVDAYRAKSLRLVRDLARESGLPVKVFDCRGGCHGTFTDWHNARTPGRAVTVELGATVPATQVRRVAGALLRVAAAD
jgi:predicted deacylase